MTKFDLKSFIIGAALTGSAALLYQGHKLEEHNHQLMVTKEVGTMLLQGQNEMEIVMNVKSTTDLKEVHAALAYYKESTK